jgi:hypothetical protein
MTPVELFAREKAESETQKAEAARRVAEIRTEELEAALSQIVTGRPYNPKSTESMERWIEGAKAIALEYGVGSQEAARRATEEKP